jgi:flagellar motor switch protein FliG
MSVNLKPELIPGIRKAAILLVTLGEEASAELLKQLEEEEVQTIGREVARLNSISAEQCEEILAEFHQMSLAHDYVVKGGIDYARKL